MIRNLFCNIPDVLPEELTEVLASSSSVRIERIVSRGHVSPEGFWYKQAHNELVVLLSGSAALAFEGRDQLVEMRPGDFVDIKAHISHRVARTDSEVDTVWLAIHY